MSKLPLTLADIPPDARGVPYAKWLAQRVVCTPEERRAFHERETAKAVEAEAKAEEKRKTKRGVR